MRLSIDDLAVPRNVILGVCHFEWGASLEIKEKKEDITKNKLKASKLYCETKWATLKWNGRASRKVKYCHIALPL
jgi:hypothetical protein